MASLRIVLIALFTTTASAQATWFVDAAVAGPGTGTAADPFPAIQDGIDAASNGDFVLVHAGTYAAFDFMGKALTVGSLAGAMATTVVTTNTCYSCTGAARAVIAAGGQAVLDGFTLTGASHGVVCSGDGAALTIANCIVENNAYEGVYENAGSQASFDLTVEGCTFTNNGKNCLSVTGIDSLTVLNCTMAFNDEPLGSEQRRNDLDHRV